jgi:hypothetical protein
MGAEWELQTVQARYWSVDDIKKLVRDTFSGHSDTDFDFKVSYAPNLRQASLFHRIDLTVHEQCNNDTIQWKAPKKIGIVQKSHPFHSSAN